MILKRFISYWMTKQIYIRRVAIWSQAITEHRSYNEFTCQTCQWAIFTLYLIALDIFRHEKLCAMAWAPIRCVILHFRDRRGAASIAPLQTSRCKSPILCVNRSRVRYGFLSCRQKVIRSCVNIITSLKLLHALLILADGNSRLISVDWLELFLLQ